jgi:hypothetical protein
LRGEGRGIPQHNYFYSKIVILKNPLLRLKIIRNIIGNKKKLLNEQVLKSMAEA